MQMSLLLLRRGCLAFYCLSLEFQACISIVLLGSPPPCQIDISKFASVSQLKCHLLREALPDPQAKVVSQSLTFIHLP